MTLFDRKEVNTSRQFEFDLAKAICILGMVFVHCFEEMPQTAASSGGTAYYVVVIVLDVIFGAGTFMICMGMGTTYSHSSPEMLIKRGITIFILGYVLNLCRGAIPVLIIYHSGRSIIYALEALLCTDIMPFAGLALLLMGILLKLMARLGIRRPDLGLFLAALAMSIAGSFIRSVNFGNVFLNEIVGTLIGTKDPANELSAGVFPLLNWFIIVVYGCLIGKLIRRCRDMNKLYAITLPVSAAVIIAYIAIAVPNHLGMMSGDIFNYYHMTTPETLVLLAGAVLALSVYHFIAKLIPDRAKRVITKLSSNINTVYCIHWVMVEPLAQVLAAVSTVCFSTGEVILIGIVIYVLANILAELVQSRKRKKRAMEAR